MIERAGKCSSFRCFFDGIYTISHEESKLENCSIEHNNSVIFVDKMISHEHEPTIERERRFIYLLVENLSSHKNCSMARSRR